VFSKQHKLVGEKLLKYIPDKY